jgi:hypothetical protein
MRPATTPAHCPDCHQLVTAPPDASGATAARCPRCAYVLLIFASGPPPGYAPGPGADREGAAWRRFSWLR